MRGTSHVVSVLGESYEPSLLGWFVAESILVSPVPAFVWMYSQAKPYLILGFLRIVPNDVVSCHLCANCRYKIC